MAAELQHLVEEQHAVVREAHSPGRGCDPPPTSAAFSNRVMRRAERPPRLQPIARPEQPGDRMDRTSPPALRRTTAAARRRPPALAIIVLPAPRTDQQQVVPAGGGDFEADEPGAGP